jgi:hypothetical protein
MNETTAQDKRKDPRFETALPINFNLIPDYRYPYSIVKFGVKGKLRNVSLEGIGIESHMDLEDVCQIFPEAIEEDSPFELEVFLWDSKGKCSLMRGSVRWYEVGEPDSGIRQFKAGLYLRNDKGRSVTESIIESKTLRN